MPFKMQLVKKISSGRNWFKTKMEIVDSLFFSKIKSAPFIEVRILSYLKDWFTVLSQLESLLQW